MDQKKRQSQHNLTEDVQQTHFQDAELQELMQQGAYNFYYPGHEAMLIAALHSEYYRSLMFNLQIANSQIGALAAAERNLQAHLQNPLLNANVRANNLRMFEHTLPLPRLPNGNTSVAGDFPYQTELPLPLQPNAIKESTVNTSIGQMPHMPILQAPIPLLNESQPMSASNMLQRTGEQPSAFEYSGVLDNPQHQWNMMHRTPNAIDRLPNRLPPLPDYGVENLLSNAQNARSLTTQESKSKKCEEDPSSTNSIVKDHTLPIMPLINASNKMYMSSSQQQYGGDNGYLHEMPKVFTSEYDRELQSAAAYRKTPSISHFNHFGNNQNLMGGTQRQSKQPPYSRNNDPEELLVDVQDKALLSVAEKNKSKKADDELSWTNPLTLESNMQQEMPFNNEPHAFYIKNLHPQYASGINSQVDKMSMEMLPFPPLVRQKREQPSANTSTGLTVNPRDNIPLSLHHPNTKMSEMLIESDSQPEQNNVSGKARNPSNLSTSEGSKNTKTFTAKHKCRENVNEPIPSGHDLSSSRFCHKPNENNQEIMNSKPQLKTSAILQDKIHDHPLLPLHKMAMNGRGSATHLTTLPSSDIFLVENSISSSRLLLPSHPNTSQKPPAKDCSGQEFTLPVTHQPMLSTNALKPLTASNSLSDGVDEQFRRNPMAGFPFETVGKHQTNVENTDAYNETSNASQYHKLLRQDSKVHWQMSSHKKQLDVTSPNKDKEKLFSANARPKPQKRMIVETISESLDNETNPLSFRNVNQNTSVLNEQIKEMSKEHCGEPQNKREHPEMSEPASCDRHHLFDNRHDTNTLKIPRKRAPVSRHEDPEDISPSHIHRGTYSPTPEKAKSIETNIRTHDSRASDNESVSAVTVPNKSCLSSLPIEARTNAMATSSSNVDATLINQSLPKPYSSFQSIQGHQVLKEAQNSLIDVNKSSLTLRDPSITCVSSRTKDDREPVATTANSPMNIARPTLTNWGPPITSVTFEPMEGRLFIGEANKSHIDVNESFLTQKDLPIASSKSQTVEKFPHVVSISNSHANFDQSTLNHQDPLEASLSSLSLKARSHAIIENSKIYADETTCYFKRKGLRMTSQTIEDCIQIKTQDSDEIATESTASDEIATESTASDVIATESTASDVIATESTASDVIAPESTASDVTATESTASDVTSTESTTSDGIATESRASDVIATESTASDVIATESTASGVIVTESTASDVIATGSRASDVIATESTASDVIATESTASDVTATESTASDVTATESTTSEVIVTESRASDVIVTESTASDVIATESTAPDKIATESTTSDVIVTESTASNVIATKSTASDDQYPPKRCFSSEANNEQTHDVKTLSSIERSLAKSVPLQGLDKLLRSVNSIVNDIYDTYSNISGDESSFHERDDTTNSQKGSLTPGSDFEHSISNSRIRCQLNENPLEIDMDNKDTTHICDKSPETYLDHDGSYQPEATPSTKTKADGGLPNLDSPSKKNEESLPNCPNDRLSQDIVQQTSEIHYTSSKANTHIQNKDGSLPKIIIPESVKDNSAQNEASNCFTPEILVRSKYDSPIDQTSQITERNAQPSGGVEKPSSSALSKRYFPPYSRNKKEKSKKLNSTKHATRGIMNKETESLLLNELKQMAIDKKDSSCETVHAFGNYTSKSPFGHTTGFDELPNHNQNPLPEEAEESYKKRRKIETGLSASLDYQTPTSDENRNRSETILKPAKFKIPPKSNENMYYLSILKGHQENEKGEKSEGNCSMDAYSLAGKQCSPLEKAVSPESPSGPPQLSKISPLDRAKACSGSKPTGIGSQSSPDEYGSPPVLDRQVSPEVIGVAKNGVKVNCHDKDTSESYPETLEQLGRHKTSATDTRPRLSELDNVSINTLKTRSSEAIADKLEREKLHETPKLQKTHIEHSSESDFTKSTLVSTPQRPQQKSHHLKRKTSGLFNSEIQTRREHIVQSPQNLHLESDSYSFLGLAERTEGLSQNQEASFTSTSCSRNKKTNRFSEDGNGKMPLKKRNLKKWQDEEFTMKSIDGKLKNNFNAMGQTPSFPINFKKQKWLHRSDCSKERQEVLDDVYSPTINSHETNKLGSYFIEDSIQSDQKVSCPLPINYSKDRNLLHLDSDQKQQRNAPENLLSSTRNAIRSKSDNSAYFTESDATRTLQPGDLAFFQFYGEICPSDFEDDSIGRLVIGDNFSGADSHSRGETHQVIANTA